MGRQEGVWQSRLAKQERWVQWTESSNLPLRGSCRVCSCSTIIREFVIQLGDAMRHEQVPSQCQVDSKTSITARAFLYFPMSTMLSIQAFPEDIVLLRTLSQRLERKILCVSNLRRCDAPMRHAERQDRVRLWRLWRSDESIMQLRGLLLASSCLRFSQ